VSAKVQPLYAPPEPLDGQRFETIQTFMGLASSLCKSAEEAAWRGNKELVGRHLMEAKRAVDNSLKVFDELGRMKP
jgi:hypothetical protein